MKCHRTGQTIYPMDNPIKIKIDGEDVFFSKAGFKCKECGAVLKVNENNWDAYSEKKLGPKDVYHKHHKPVIGRARSVYKETSTRTAAPPGVAAASEPAIPEDAEGADEGDDEAPLEVPAAEPAKQGPPAATPAAAPDAESTKDSVPVAPISAPTASSAATEAKTKTDPVLPRLSFDPVEKKYQIGEVKVGSKTASSRDPTAQNLEKFRAINAKSPDDQSQFFLMQFAVEFTGRSEEVLECADVFKRYLTNPTDSSLSEVDSHRMLEALGRAKTYQEMRELIREIDQDSDGRLSVIEWLLFEYKQTVNALFEGPPVPPELAETMRVAIEKWHAVHDKKMAKLTEVEELEALAAQGGMRGSQAKIKLAAIRQLGVDGNDNASEIRADIGKKRAEKQVEEHVARKAAEEKARVEEKRRAEEAAEKARRAEARARIMAMAGKFGDTKDTEA